ADEFEPLNPETYPGHARITYEFDARGDMPPVNVHWYEGKKDGVLVQPPVDLLQGEKMSNSASLIVGSKGTMYSPDDYGGRSIWLPKDQYKDMKKPAPTLPRSPGHHKEWVDAALGSGKPPMSNFDYAGPLTEFVLLGNLALRIGKRFEWDAENMKAKGLPE